MQESTIRRSNTVVIFIQRISRNEFAKTSLQCLETALLSQGDEDGDEEKHYEEEFYLQVEWEKEIDR
jgi:hypothetical protein